jgi:hypothetical protein
VLKLYRVVGVGRRLVRADGRMQVSMSLCQDYGGYQ